jgi:hypothetical protein
MNTQKSNAAAARSGKDENPSRSQTAPTTPGADMQPEDAGTPASGNANQGSPAAPVMKQFAKTDAERGGRH